MKIIVPLCLVVLLALIAWVGTSILNLTFLFGVVIPYAAFAVFVVGFVVRIVRWGKSAVPFRIPTTGGQQKSLPWIKYAKTDNPSTFAGVIGRMLLEVLFFRSLFRGTKTEKKGDKLYISSAKWLWFFALLFHWSMLLVVLRHFRLFLDPVPAWVTAIEGLDGMFQIGVPVLYLTDALLVSALTFLFLRRVVIPRLRYISLSVDYFPLFLLLGIAITGICMRYVYRIDITTVKSLTMALVSFQPAIIGEIQPIFYMHLFLVSTLLAYFPASKLMHAGGIFLSPTRNLANNSRAVRHVNPWNYPVKVHTYAEYEEEFGEKMKNVGLPLDSDAGVTENV
ncbi:sulfate reduction electron transfer complex DsrMKJOP subunit DsrM [Curtanaerobium respiraculi]|uniref:sulfate reduction electron transfer complex DsrMKJOP subunit DsrM n=1 Tax=Curtanaerobium respiraculi TaxID=2949669 RepID=UPI0024B3C42D|nr:sulfate reduction electron transfer complex DsrMKJOP subunit DsrM [Curtanaerobium respiraculi]